MSFRSRFDRFNRYMGALRECSGAFEAGRKPNRAALETLGLKPDVFDNVRFR